MPVVSQPVMSLIQSYGIDMKHRPAAEAMADKPWKADPSAPPFFKIKGLLQQVRPDSRADYPEGGLKAVMVLLVKAGARSPRPGDRIEVNDQGWRIATVLPLASDHRQTVIEALVNLNSTPFEDS